MRYSHITKLFIDHVPMHLYRPVIKSCDPRHLLWPNMLDFPRCYRWNYLLLIEFNHKVTGLLQVWRTRLLVTQKWMTVLLYLGKLCKSGPKLSVGMNCQTTQIWETLWLKTTPDLHFNLFIGKTSISIRQNNFGSQASLSTWNSSVQEEDNKVAAVESKTKHKLSLLTSGTCDR